MDKIAVFANDIDHARQVLEPMLAGGSPTHWVLVACPPTLTRHIGRWVSNQARQQWRERWSNDLFVALEPMLKAHPGSRLEKVVARKPLVELCGRLQARLGTLRILDARRPKVGRVEEPLTAGQNIDHGGRWAAPVALSTGVSAILALAD